MKEYKGFSLFSDVLDKKLQARNRFVVSRNIAEQYGHAVSRSYLKQFTKPELVAIYLIVKEET